MTPGPSRDLRHAVRQLKGARTSLANLRTGLSGEADALALDALVTLACVLADLAKVRRMAGESKARRAA